LNIFPWRDSNPRSSVQEDGEGRCEVMEQLVKFITSEEFGFEQSNLVASHLSEILQEQFEGRIFPADPRCAIVLNFETFEEKNFNLGGNIFVQKLQTKIF
jgi:hypothetical protein